MKFKWLPAAVLKMLHNRSLQWMTRLNLLPDHVSELIPLSNSIIY